MLKRLMDIVLSLSALLVFSPLILVFMILVWLQDFRSPLYIASRVARNGGQFRMAKLRSMVVDADKSGIDSTKSDDMRITTIGKIIRKLKLDELTQLWNVLIGDMSLVGPRPQVQRDVDLYTDVERGLLSVRPGITDFSSVVFADEGEILAGRDDPDLAYQQLIRPWKSRLGLFYIEKQSLMLDVELIWLTVLNAVNRQAALSKVSSRLEKLQATAELSVIAKRDADLSPFPPPGSDEIVRTRPIHP